MLHHGRCHCGKIAFEVEADFTEAVDCTCSLCRRRGGLLAFVPHDSVRLKTPVEDLSTYTFNRHIIRHHFCSRCGTAPFGEGRGADGRISAAVNLRCLPGINLDRLEIAHYNGVGR